jgi:GNAT superfamily N-acetyltransferase
MKVGSGLVKIRRATLKDLDILVEHRHEMFEDNGHRKPSQHVRADAAYRKWMIEKTRKKCFVGFLAVRDDRVVGSGCVWLREMQPSPGSDRRLKLPYLMSMYTSPKYRGKGIATSIVKEAMAWSKRKGFVTMSLHASKFGRSVYRKIGWERTWEMRVSLQ